MIEAIRDQWLIVSAVIVVVGMTVWLWTTRRRT
jgi:hypothetical protein